MAKPSRLPLMAGNWKMNLNHHEAVVLVQKLAWTLVGQEVRPDAQRGRGDPARSPTCAASRR